MIPVGDENPRMHTPWMTWLIIGVTVAVWFLVQGAGSPAAVAASVCDLGLVPGEITHRAAVGYALPMAPGLYCVIDREPINTFTPVISIFLHGGWGHLLGNMLFLMVFGDDIEDSMGPGRFLVFYLLCGIVAAAAHVAVDPASPVPTVGASGAISGIMGAYLLLYPRVRVRMLFIFIIFFKVIPIPAWLVLLWWFFVQVLTGLPELSSVRADVSSGVAVWAHIGGFLAGVLLIKLFVSPSLTAKRAALMAMERARLTAAPW
ncbi:MAG: family peptidase [Gemmatimonadetes bacterium]|jgi:membrane associated rhomboid family serine protease|nr:family peptidase [Gemmatimonadota bacterium]